MLQRTLPRKLQREREKIFTNHTSEKVIVYRICKEILQFNNKKRNNPIKNWIFNQILKDLNIHFSSVSAFKRRHTNNQ